jgi:pimeloyl-ACP methyl ester carboxylesterase
MDYDVRGFASAFDGTRLFYGVRGPGDAQSPGGARSPCLVLLDGIGCDGWAWDSIQPELARHCRVIHPHFRGHGRSGPPRDPSAIDLGTLADDAIRVLDAAGATDFVPVGHSMGTQVALEVYRRVPERVRGLVLVCGSYGRITHTFHGNDALHRALPQIIEFVGKHPGLARAVWGRLPPGLSFRIAGWLGEIDGQALPAEEFRKYVEHLSDIDLDLYLAMLQKAGEHSAADLLPNVRVPTLVIAAERDTFTPVDVVRALAEQIDGAEYLELAGASHAAPIERAAVIREHIEAFLERTFVPDLG